MNPDRQSSRVPQIPPKQQFGSIEELGFPKKVDWREKGIITAVKDQGDCGSCWAFGTAEQVESYFALATGHLYDLSIQQILDCTPNPKQCGGQGGCAGGTPEIAFAQINVTGGLASEWTYPYTSHGGANEKCFYDALTPPIANVSSFVKLPTNDYIAVIAALANTGPLVISVDANGWQHYESGVFSGCNQTNPDLDHSVQLVGYGTDDTYGGYWLVRNSWTPLWGDDGYIKINRPDNQTCGTDLHPLDGSGCAGGPATQEVCGSCGILFDTCYPIVY